MSENGEAATRVSVACIVVTYNRDDFIARCVTSLLAARGPGLDVRVTVIDNGSPDKTAEVLAGFSPTEVEVVTKTVNTPLSLVLNEGLAIGHASGADYLLVLNDDIEMREGAIAELVAVCREVPGSIVTPMQINYRQPDMLDPSMLERLQATPDLINDAVYRRDIKRYYAQRSLIGAALLARRETFARVGDFDPIFSFYGVDDDYCNRARDLGVPLLVATGAEMLHMHGRTSDTRTADKSAWLKRWTTMYRARMIFVLKTPGRSLSMAYLTVTGRALRDAVKFGLQRFPRGSVVALRTLAELVGAYGRIRDRRNEEARLAAAGAEG